MRNKLLGLISLFSLNFIFLGSVQAGTFGISNEADLINCLSGEGNVCRLISNINLSGQTNVVNDITLDMNGYTITASNETNRSFAVFNNTLTIQGIGSIIAQNEAVKVVSGKLILNDAKLISRGHNGVSVGGYSETNKVVSNKTSGEFIMNSGEIESQEFGVGIFIDSKFTMNDGLITTHDNCGIGGNGRPDLVDQKGITITMNGGKIVGNIQSNGYSSCGVYFPQKGQLNINGGEITSTKGAGVVMRGGKLLMTGGKINAQGDYSFTGKVGDSRVVVPVSSIVVDQAAKYSDYTNIAVDIKGGEFNSVVSDITFLPENAENKAISVSGGTFSRNFADSYLATGFDKNVVDGKYQVAIRKINIAGTNEEATDIEKILEKIVKNEDLTPALSNIRSQIMAMLQQGGELSVKVNKQELESVYTDVKEKILDKLNDREVGKYYDINYVITNGVTNVNIPELGEKVKISLKKPELEAVKDGFKRIFTVLRYHEGNVDELEVTEENDNLNFESDSFSTYLLAYKDVAIDGSDEGTGNVTEETNEETNDKISINPNTGDTILLTVVILGLASYSLIHLRRKFHC